MDDSMRDLLHSAADRALSYLDNLDKRSVSVSAEAMQRLARLDEALPEMPTEPEAVLALLDEIGSPATIATAGPRFFGFVIGGSVPAALAANWLAGAWDQNGGVWGTSPLIAQTRGRDFDWVL